VDGVSVSTEVEGASAAPSLLMPFYPATTDEPRAASLSEVPR